MMQTPARTAANRLRDAVGRFGVSTAGHLPPGVRRAVNTARGIQTPRLVDHPHGRRPVALAPHPDDELLGAGGTLVHHVRSGHAAAIVHLTSGERTAGLAHLPTAERAPTREAEARAAATRLGVTDVEMLRFPDGGVGRATEEQTARIARALAVRRADLVYAPWPVDAHRDHTAATRLLAGALAQVPTVERIALYEVWSPLPPTHLVDIGDAIEDKLEALGCYASALVAVDYRHTARGLAAYRSAQGLRGAGYAEAFTVVDPDGLHALLDRLDR